ncbi:DNA-binding NarL/FixJ family response regulator [Caulobacter sp. BE264]|uniref:helix-turn-helix transcriptional regulator n=1 Tax=Caulobacter sp. BE264 TaxID=2817724 RepID=UPI00285DCC5D|nr:response regulator transcription factor [Caulobacter sp. BE264]MDR7231996.1 DNA-binding NarL/FixJ family response regulator [Caulobacter sp. BE264]
MLTALVSEALHTDAVSVGSGFELPHDRCFDLLLVDLGDATDPLAAISEAARVKARHRVLFAAWCDLALARLAYARRFNGLIPENAKQEMRVAILRLVMAGGEYFPWIKRPEARASERPSIARLSKRQREVLGHLLDGKTNKQIAEALGISLATVKLHVQGILGEAGAKNRTEAVVRFGGLQDRT